MGDLLPNYRAYPLDVSALNAGGHFFDLSHPLTSGQYHDIVRIANNGNAPTAHLRFEARDGYIRLMLPQIMVYTDPSANNRFSPRREYASYSFIYSITYMLCSVISPYHLPESFLRYPLILPVDIHSRMICKPDVSFLL